MTVTFNIDELNISSQTQLLSRIQFLTRFSSNLVQISGPTGAGKTWLSEHYLSDWATDATQVLLLCNPSQKDEQHRAIILRQITRENVYKQQHSLLKSLNNIVTSNGIHALIVIDDAHLLSQSLISELWQLVSTAQERNGWQINVLLFAQPFLLTKALKKAAKNHHEKPLELDIPELTDNECEQFIDAAIERRDLDANERRLYRERAIIADSYPGPILSAANNTVPAVIKPPARFSWRTAAVSALLLLAIGGSVTWLTLSDNSPTQWLAKWFGDNDAQQESAANRNLLLQSKEDHITIPDAITLNGPSVGLDDDADLRQKVIVSAQEVESIISTSSENGDSPLELGDAVRNAISEITKKELPTAGNQSALAASGLAPIIEQKLSEPTPAPKSVTSLDEPVEDEADLFRTDVADAPPVDSAETASSKSKPVDKPKATKRPQATAKVSTLSDKAASAAVIADLQFALANNMLLSIPSTRYALQLGAFRSHHEVKEFLEHYDLEGRVQVYETRRDGNSWFMVLLGDYASASEARNTQARLSEPLKNLGPWAKSFTQIHKEIKRVQ
ncbi:MAG: AAA family ATPase [Vibrionaceae bacterium]